MLRILHLVSLFELGVSNESSNKTTTLGQYTIIHHVEIATRMMTLSQHFRQDFT